MGRNGSPLDKKICWILALAKAHGPLEHVCFVWKPKVPFISADILLFDLLVQAELPLLLEDLKIQVTLH